MSQGTEIFTIGHSNHTMDAFVHLLKMHSIQHLIDTRSYPNSKFAPHFNAHVLKSHLREEAIYYHYYGKKLGGRPREPHYYDEEGYVLYYEIAKTKEFVEGISSVKEEAARYRIALMCSEENPLNCHRRLLIARVLLSEGVDIKHIRGNGKIETESELLKRQHAVLNQANLFQDAVEDRTWKSIQSVLPKKAPASFSGH